MKLVSLAFRLAVLTLVIFGTTLTQIHHHYSKAALFQSVQPQDASTSRRLLASFKAPSEVACSQKCLRHENCNYKVYDSKSKKCELLRSISREDTSTNGKKTLMKIRRVPDQILKGGLEKKCFMSSETLLNCAAKGPYKSCKAALESNAFQTAVYRILHASFENPVNVECMKDASGTSFAVLHHNNERATTVSGYGAKGSYKYNFEYSMDMSVITALINQSSHCQQFTKGRCRHIFFYRTDYDWNTWISGRNGLKLDFWGGGPSDGTGCACGITNTCHVAQYKCNCDTNDQVWRIDEGNVVKRDVLPITSINSGDTGDSLETFEYTIGPLLCVI